MSEGAMVQGTTEAQQVNRLEQGREHYNQGNYEEALQQFLSAAEAEPENAVVYYFTGLTYQGMLDYSEAANAFTRAVELEPGLGDGWSHLAEMQYRQRDHDQAIQSIAQAEANGARAPYTAYIKGLVQMELGAGDEAITSLKRSYELDPAYKQKALYAIGMVHSKTNNRKDAEKAFREAIAINPKSVVGVYADFGLQHLNKPQKRHLHLTLDYSFQYDDNVVLNPNGAAAAVIPSGQGDFTHVANLHAGFAPEKYKRFGIRVDGNYYKSLHHQLKYMDLDGLSASLTPSVDLGFGTLSVAGRKDAYWVGRNHYVDITGAYPNFTFALGDRQYGMLYGGYQKKRYFNQLLPVAAENRDGINYSAGYTHYIYLAEQQGYLGLSYVRDVENTNGNNWDYKGNRFTASLLYPLTDVLKLQLNGDYYLQNYWKVHSTYGVKRRDKTLTIAPKVSWQLNPWAAVHLQYTHVQANSNIAVYKYRRNIFAAGFELFY